MPAPLLLSLVLLAPVQAAAAAPSPAAQKPEPEGKEPGRRDAPEEAPVVTRHTLRVGAKTLGYSVTTGLMPLKNEAGEVEAEIFFMAYVADRQGGPDTRPLMFSFNGGPGSSSVWLHLGALGPRRVKMEQDGGMPAPPYRLVDNEHSWLELTDLVFVDPVGTGFSRARTPELGKKFWGVKGDLESVGEFIRLYLTRHERWASPLFLVGESYGTTRAAGLAGHLVERGIAFNGIVLVSSILNFQTARFSKGNDLPYPLFLPTYAATAWYHKKLPEDLQRKPLPEVLAEVEAFAGVEYPAILAKGDRLTADERTGAGKRIARYTGLDQRFVELSDLRIEIRRFCKELLRDRRRTVGRLDSRFLGIDARPADDTPEFDPSMSAIRPPFTATFNQYVRGSLGYKSDRTYYILGGGIGPWDWGSAGEGHPDTSEALRSAFSQNPDMKVFVASGFYDLATPYFATEHTLAHMGLEPEQRGRISAGRYEAGHMMYIHEAELARLKKDVAAFIQGALGGRGGQVLK